jgi:hypothetical protein
VFTPAEAAAHGVTPRMLQGARFTQVFLGAWRTTSTPETEELRVRAAVKVLPDDAALSHISNVRRQARLRSEMLRGVPVMPAARTFVDVATDVDDRQLLRIGDWLVRHGHVDLIDLRAFAVAEHLDGVQRARRVAPLVRERVDSVRESDVRWILHAAGLPAPEPNVPIVDARGIRVAKGDLVYVRWKVIVEHDGWHHERDADQRQRDHLRRERLDALGWRVIVITAADFRHEKSIAWRVHDALRQAGYTGPRPIFGA